MPPKTYTPATREELAADERLRTAHAHQYHLQCPTYPLTDAEAEELEQLQAAYNKVVGEERTG